MATSDQRAHMAAVMQLLIAHAQQIGYIQERPMPTAHLLEQQLTNQLKRAAATQEVITPDCSETVTVICRMAGLADPTGSGYNGYGNTDSMYEHLSHYTDAAAAGIGSIFCYGPAGATKHVNMVLEPGTDPVIFNHGSERRAYSIPFSQFKAENPQLTPITFLSVGGL